ncbi:Multidrug resistance protein MexB [Vibrio stylophorae]|uniref:Multidrug resistance protein MexB n=1 Tax=Vibrio stylophorae TaxID=659351 RepID=A0ABM8ZUF2_9VIBR|nr:multidrug efflux RND transporter permease subunit [Vibrio stylophorae]CAH0533949.1 Multidrug resistance protein MexB [Vibrio stylophorae]
MWLSDTSVKRPVVALVLSLLLCIFGAVSFTKLAVREMPDVDSPVISIMTRYDGASASIMESQVSQVLEDQLSGISGIDTIVSTSRNGMSWVTITFDLEWDILEGLSDVRDAVARAQGRLPEEADEPIVSRDNGEGEPAIYIKLSSPVMDRTQLTDYAERELMDRFNLITGVSSVDLYGALYKVMYVKLDPVRMAGRGVTTSDIVNALRSENLESPGGEVRNDVTVMAVRTERLYNTAEDFSQLVVRHQNGLPIYLKDVADVYVGAMNEDATFKSDGVQTLSLAVINQSDANPVSVAQDVIAEVAAMQPFLPDQMTFEVDYDSSLYIDRSITEVYVTLAMTAVLVILVLYIFIGQVRATIIPAVTVPVSLISAFICAYAFGYSINLLTLMALILAIGLVVDDAIVVVENIFHHIEQGESPLLAAYKGTREVGFAVIATTLVLVMVFLPISFMDGMVGRFFTEFSVMLAVSVMFSSLIALTLTPVLASKLLKLNVKKGRFAAFMDRIFARVEAAYRRCLGVVMRGRWWAPVVMLGCIGLAGLLFKAIPSDLLPSQDRGVIFAFVKGAEGTSYNRMVQNMNEVEARLLPLVGNGVVKSISYDTPAFGGRAGDQTAFVIIQLEDWNDRDMHAKEALGMVAGALDGLSDIRVWPFMPGAGGGSGEPVGFVLSGSDYQELNKWAQVLKHEADSSGLMRGADIDYAETTPELLVRLNRQRAAELGISVREISETLEVMLGGRSETTFVDHGEEYDVYLRGNEDSFNHSSDLSQIYLRGANGSLVTLDTVASVEEVASAQKLTHYQKQKSITLKAHLSEGATLSEALDFLDRRAMELLPKDITIHYSGESKDFKENQSSAMMVFGLALLVAYLVLAAQFESFVNPLVVMFTVPLGILGGLIGLWIMGLSLDVFSQIGMIMLIGMVTKNGILIVEFANQLRDQGRPFEQAIIDASVRRLRPILMTAFTTLLGAVPLIISTGAGYESRMAVGTVVFFGMAVATLITLGIIPAMYRLMCQYSHSPGYVAAQLAKLESEDHPVRHNHG